jgi:sugar phosphate isomerase/epimerase
VPEERLKLACADHSFPLLEHVHALTLISMLGFEGLDLGVMGNRSHIRPEMLRGDIRGWAQRISSRLQSARLEVSDVFLIPWTDFATLAPNHPDATVRSQSRAMFVDVLEFAARIGAPGITLLPGIHFSTESVETSMARAVDELSWRAGRAQAAGLRCSIEAHLGSIAETPRAATELLDSSEGLELTLDYTHFVAAGTPEDAIHPLSARARHIHARGARHGRLQCSMAANTIDYGRVLEELASHGYQGYIACEYVWDDWGHMNECDNVSETAILRDRLWSLLAGDETTAPSEVAQMSRGQR